MDLGIAGKVALVTGAGSGIGRATAELLAQEGVRVVLVDREGDVISRLAAQSPEMYSSAVADLSTADAPSAVVRQVLATHERLDIMVMSAGVYETEGWENLTLLDWNAVQDVNLRSNFLLSQAAMPAMRQSQWGRIVMISSLAAETGGQAGGPAYVSSKAGVIGLTRSLSNAVAGDGITVNAVTPGFVASPMTERLGQSTLKAAAAQTPVGRIGQPEDIARVIVAVCSSGFAFVTGQTIAANGGIFHR